MMRFSIARVALATLVFAPLFSATPAFAQRDKDERCTLDGHVQVFSTGLNSWMDEVWRKCDGGSQSRRNDYSSRDQDASNGNGRYARASDRNNSEPADGDEKCGPDGTVMRYTAYNKRWNHGFVKCAD